MIGFATIYTSVPVFQLLFDQDLDESVVLSNPQIYKSLRSSRTLGARKTLEMIWWSVFQGSTIMFLSAFIFKDSFANIVLGAYSSLILFEWFQSLTSVSVFLIIKFLKLFV